MAGREKKQEENQVGRSSEIHHLGGVLKGKNSRNLKQGDLENHPVFG